MALGLSLIFGSLILGSWAGPSASAEGPVSVSSDAAFSGAVFYGYVFSETPGGLAERVRAVGLTGAVCGTAEVIRLNDVIGYYAISVASSQQKRGCPTLGGAVQFSLFAGRVDDGVWAGQVATLGVSGVPRSLNLQPAERVTGHWLGQSGDIERDSWMRWAGEPASLTSALTSLPLPTTAVYRLDTASGAFIDVTSSTEAVVTAGDLLLVRFR